MYFTEGWRGSGGGSDGGEENGRLEGEDEKNGAVATKAVMQRGLRKPPLELWPLAPARRPRSATPPTL